MPVPYLFSNVPGGTSIPLAELDANFAYFTTGTPTFLNLDITGNLTVQGTSTFVSPITAPAATISNSLTVSPGGTLTLGGDSAIPTGFTGSGLVVLNDTPTLVTPILGTPQSGNLTNCTGYEVGDLVGLGTGVLSFLQTPSSGTLAVALGDVTGSGSVVYNVSPTLVTPILGTPASGNLSNCTSLQLTGGAGVTGILPIANGGTGLNAVGVAGSVLTSDGSKLVYATATAASAVAGGAASQLLYQSDVNVTDFIPNGTAGQVLLSNGAAVPSWGQVTLTSAVTGVLPYANGGTAASTRQSAMDGLAGAVTSGRYLRGNGTNVVMASIVAADVPTLNQNTTGSAATFTSTTQNSQFNSIGVNIAPSGIPGEIKATGNIITTAGTFYDSNGPLHSVVLGTAVAASGATITFGSLPSWVNRVTLMMTGITCTPGISPIIQLGTSGGIISSGYVSYWWGPGSVGTAISNTSFATVLPNGIMDNAVFIFYKVSSTLWVASATSAVQTTAGTAQLGGNVSLGGALTQIQIALNGAGAYTGGTVNIQYE